MHNARQHRINSGWSFLSARLSYYRHPLIGQPTHAAEQRLWQVSVDTIRGSCTKADNCPSKTMSKLKCLEWKHQITISFTTKLGAQWKSHKRLLLLSSEALPASQNGNCTVCSHSTCKANTGVQQIGSAKQRCSVDVSQVPTVNVKAAGIESDHERARFSRTVQYEKVRSLTQIRVA